MAGYQATVQWSRQDADFLGNKYSRRHEWSFDGGARVIASSSPHVVPMPWSDAAAVDPEEALVVALASCHMLSFLWVAMKQGYVVDEYHDAATGTMTKSETGKYWVSEVVLHPKIAFSGSKIPDSKQLAGLHHLAHEECFIANSVKTNVRVA